MSLLSQLRTIRITRTPRSTAPPTDRVSATPLRGEVAVLTSVALAAVSLVAAGLTLVPGVLRGTPVMNGSARGTAWVVLLAAVPTLLAGVLLTRREAWLGPPLWLGALAALAYNAVMFCFATPFNTAFPAYVAMLGLAVAGLVTLLRGLRPGAVVAGYTAGPRARLAAVWIGVVTVANSLVWLRDVVPGAVTGDRSFLDGTGLTTNPVFVQDLAFWLPVAGLVAWWLWHGHPWGGLLAAGLLVFWLLEAVTVAVDQWLGAAADPGSDLATRGGSALFVTMGVLGLLVLVGYLKALRDHR